MPAVEAVVWVTLSTDGRVGTAGSELGQTYDCELLSSWRERGGARGARAREREGRFARALEITEAFISS